MVSSQDSIGEEAAPKFTLWLLTECSSPIAVTAVPCWSLVGGGPQLLVMQTSPVLFIRRSSGEEEPGRQKERENERES